TNRAGTYEMELNTTPRIYLSFYGPSSKASIPENTAQLKAPLLWIAGTQDPTQRGMRAYAFDRVPADPHNRYVELETNHLDAPDAATDTILAWLKELPSR